MGEFGIMALVIYSCSLGCDRMTCENIIDTERKGVHEEMMRTFFAEAEIFMK